MHNRRGEAARLLASLPVLNTEGVSSLQKHAQGFDFECEYVRVSSHSELIT